MAPYKNRSSHVWNGRICKQTIPSVGSSRSANCPRSLAARQVLRLFHPPSLHGNGRYPRCETLLSRQGTCVCCSEEGKHPVQSTWRVHPNQVRLHGRAMFTVLFYKVYVEHLGVSLSKPWRLWYCQHGQTVHPLMNNFCMMHVGSLCQQSGCDLPCWQFTSRF